MASKVVFLSHQTKDKPVVREVARYLSGHDIEPILDVWTFVRGQSLQEEIAKNIDRSDSFVLFWSSLASNSEYVQFEDEIAVAQRLKDNSYTVQVVLLDSTPLSKKHSFQIYHDWRRGKLGSKLFEKHLNRLTRAISGLPDEEPPSKTLDRRRSHIILPFEAFLSVLKRVYRCKLENLEIKWWSHDDFGSGDRSWIPHDADRWLAGINIIKPLPNGAKGVENVFEDPCFYSQKSQTFGETLVNRLKFNSYASNRFLSAIAVSSKQAKLNKMGIPTKENVFIVFDGYEYEDY